MVFAKERRYASDTTPDLRTGDENSMIIADVYEMDYIESERVGLIPE